MKAAMGLVAILLAAPALAAPCDGFTDALAYNACLARQGPAARAVHLGAAPTRVGAGRQGVSGRTPRRVSGSGGTARAHGCAEMIFTPRK
jgi:hypothetical protein